MSLLTIVIDDKSPLISYSDAGWAPGTSTDDDLASEYYLGTFQKTNTDGAATFSFNGSTVWIYGANRENHGWYTVQLDDTISSPLNGSGNNLFQQELFNTTVDQGMHVVTITNNGGSLNLYLDIDMVVWQSVVGSADSQLVPEVVQDLDSRFRYQPGWETASSSGMISNLFNNGSGHATNLYGASVSFTFKVRNLSADQGEAVTLFGTSGPLNGQYTVQLDNGPNVTYDASNVAGSPTNYGVALYHANNLGSGNHEIVLTNTASSSDQYLVIDYAQLWSVANSSNLIAVPPSSSGSTSQTLGTGAIVGLVIEGVVALLIAVVAIFLYRRWKAALKTSHTYYSLLPLAGTTGGSSNPFGNGRSFLPVPANDASHESVVDNGAVRMHTSADSTDTPPVLVSVGERAAGRRRRLPVPPQESTGNWSSGNAPSSQLLIETLEGGDGLDEPPPGYETATTRDYAILGSR